MDGAAPSPNRGLVGETEHKAQENETPRSITPSLGNQVEETRSCLVLRFSTLVFSPVDDSLTIFARAAVTPTGLTPTGGVGAPKRAAVVAVKEGSYQEQFALKADEVDTFCMSNEADNFCMRLQKGQWWMQHQPCDLKHNPNPALDTPSQDEPSPVRLTENYQQKDKYVAGDRVPSRSLKCSLCLEQPAKTLLSCGHCFCDGAACLSSPGPTDTCPVCAATIMFTTRVLDSGLDHPSPSANCLSASLTLSATLAVPADAWQCAIQALPPIRMDPSGYHGGAWYPQNDPKSGKLYWTNHVLKKTLWEPPKGCFAQKQLQQDGALGAQQYIHGHTVQHGQQYLQEYGALGAQQHAAQHGQQCGWGADATSSQCANLPVQADPSGYNRGVWYPQNDPKSGKLYWTNHVLKKTLWEAPKGCQAQKHLQQDGALGVQRYIHGHTVQHGQQYEWGQDSKQCGWCQLHEGQWYKQQHDQMHSSLSVVPTRRTFSTLSPLVPSPSKLAEAYQQLQHQYKTAVEKRDALQVELRKEKEARHRDQQETQTYLQERDAFQTELKKCSALLHTRTHALSSQDSLSLNLNMQQGDQEKNLRITSAANGEEQTMYTMRCALEDILMQDHDNLHVPQVSVLSDATQEEEDSEEETRFVSSSFLGPRLRKEDSDCHSVRKHLLLDDSDDGQDCDETQQTLRCCSDSDSDDDTFTSMRSRTRSAMKQAANLDSEYALPPSKSSSDDVDCSLNSSSELRESCRKRSSTAVRIEKGMDSENGGSKRKREHINYTLPSCRGKFRRGADMFRMNMMGEGSLKKKREVATHGETDTTAGINPTSPDAPRCRQSPWGESGNRRESRGFRSCRKDVNVEGGFTGGLLSTRDGIIDGFSREEETRRVGKIKALVRASSGYVSRTSEKAPALRVGTTLQLQRPGQEVGAWQCERLLGKGNWASVYMLRRVKTSGDLLSGLDDVADSQLQRIALKVLGEANVWEMYVSSALQSALKDTAKSTFTKFESVVDMKHGTWLLSGYKAQSSLQQVINVYRKANTKMSEPLVMFYAIELIRAVEALHATGILHADIKPDNVLLRDDDESNSLWEYTPGAGFGAKGVELIDYGCAIDTNMYPSSTLFSGRSKTEAFECLEMLCNKPWTTQVDLYNVAATIHCLLYSEYMTVEITTDAYGITTAAPKQALKRYWKGELWHNFFETLINAQSRGAPPNLAALRREFEDYFAQNDSQRAAVRVCLLKQGLLLDQFLD